jgi:ATP-binding cassette subfamily B protein
VLPFLGVLVAPERVFHQPLIARAAAAAGITSAAQLMLPMTVLFAAMSLIAGAIRLFVLWASTRFSFALGVDLSIDMYRRSLYQPYRVHVARNSSEVISGIASKTSTVVVGVILPFLFGVSAIVVLVAVVLTSLAIDSTVAAVSAVGFGVTYGAVTLLSRRRLALNSDKIAQAQTQLFKTLNEGLGGIRDILLDGTQAVYCDIYHRADLSLRRAQGSNTFISASPRYAMEALGMTLLAFLAYFTLIRVGDVGVALPVLGALALGAQRLIPTFQQAYASWSTMLGSRASLADTLALLDQPLPADALLPPPPPAEFHLAIRFEQVRFRYSTDGPWVIEGLTLEIPKGARIGVVGTTGSGKSTAADLLMGLLDPTEGDILVDGRSITGSMRRAWQRTIAHVPQAVFLADATLAENIAFGVPPAAIDIDRVRDAARRAQIAEFIEQGRDGYHAMVGERGVRLSGGQRQRIGIARALYKRASVLIFDEATSALDNATEQAVIDAIEALGKDLTIIVIAHRLTTIRNCDRIIELEHGRQVFEGRYADLLARVAVSQ